MWPLHLRLFVDLASEWRSGDLPLRQVLSRRAQTLRALSSGRRRVLEAHLYTYARERDSLERDVDLVISQAPPAWPRPTRRERLLLIWQAMHFDEGQAPEVKPNQDWPLDLHWAAPLKVQRAETRKDLSQSFPPDVVQELRARLGEEQAELALVSLNQRAPLNFRLRSVDKREAILAQLRAEGYPASAHPLVVSAIVVESGHKLDSHPLVKSGELVVQDAASQLALMAFDVKPGMQVVDYCAGGGGKAQGIATLLDGAGALALIDNDAKRLQSAKRRLGGLKKLSTQSFTQDGREAIPPEIAAWADRVLVDAPCSGLGTIRRQPDLRWRYKPADILGFTRDQRDLATQAVQTLKLGGRLLYTTCSLRSAENEAVAKSLRADPRLRPVPLTQVLPEAITVQLDLDDNHCTLWPHKNQTDGFFIALFERVS